MRKRRERLERTSRRTGLSVKEICVFSVLGALMYASKIVMDALPNIHLIAMFIALYTVVFRAKALYPIYVFVFLTGLMNGFGTWWFAYLYIWAILWAVIMLIPRNAPKWVYFSIIPVVCALHGFAYGTMCAPVEALVRSYTFKEMLAWISMGIYFDMIHGISNFAMAFLVFPLSKELKKALALLK
ncbi:MAG: hypothetical protein IJF55_01770 [Clostridia bacterium]|nr:hypothetical protein [Clostridia bacterium]